jgi:hypothetical protein
MGQVVEILEAAKASVWRHGWCRGWRENALCCLSHKQAVVRERYYMDRHDSWRIKTGIDLNSAAEKVMGDAVLELYPMIRELYTHKRASSGTLVIVWNDKICETQEQAIKLFDKAIEIAEARRL